MDKLEEVARRHLGKDRVKSVWVEQSLNEAGDTVLRVFVVYDGGKGAPTAEEMLRVTSDLWDQNVRDGRTDVVVPSFITADDDQTLRSA
jgi:hypothetical protein